MEIEDLQKDLGYEIESVCHKCESNYDEICFEDKGYSDYKKYCPYFQNTLDY